MDWRGQLFAKAEKMARRGDIDGLRRFVENGFDIRNLGDAEGYTFAQHAAAKGFIDEALARFFFCELDLDPLERTLIGSDILSPFDLIMPKLDIDVARVLFFEAKHKVSPEWRSEETGNTILSVMAYCLVDEIRRPGAISFFVEKAKIDPEAKNNNGKTAGDYFARQYSSPVLFSSWAGYVSWETAEETWKSTKQCRDNTKLALKLASFVRFVKNPGTPCETEFWRNGRTGYGKVKQQDIPTVYNEDVAEDILDFAEEFGDEGKTVFADMFAQELEMWKGIPAADDFVSSVGAILASKSCDEEGEIPIL